MILALKIFKKCSFLFSLKIKKKLKRDAEAPP